MRTERAMQFLASHQPETMRDQPKMKLALVSFGEGPDEAEELAPDSLEASEGATKDADLTESAGLIYQEMSEPQREAFCRMVQTVFPPSPDVTTTELDALLL